MLFNIYVKLLGEIISRFRVRYHQYSEYTQFYLSFAITVENAVQTLEHCLVSILERTRANRLKLNPGKTEDMFLGGSTERLGIVVPRLDGTALLLRDQVQNLGMLLDMLSFLGCPDCICVQISLPPA